MVSRAIRSPRSYTAELEWYTSTSRFLQVGDCASGIYDRARHIKKYLNSARADQIICSDTMGCIREPLCFHQI